MQSKKAFTHSIVGLALALCLVCAAKVRAQVAPPPAATPAAGATNGAYTLEQAARGDSVFSQKCVACHTRKDYSNPDFQLKWQGRTAFDLFEKIRTTMPDDSPGSLGRDVYADLTAYLLKLNGMPTGSAPLPPDSTTLVNVKLELVPPPPPTTSSASASSYFAHRLFTASFPRGR